jgi:hypothetical protein
MSQRGDLPSQCTVGTNEKTPRPMLATPTALKMSGRVGTFGDLRVIVCSILEWEAEYSLERVWRIEEGGNSALVGWAAQP